MKKKNRRAPASLSLRFEIDEPIKDTFREQSKK